MDFLGIKAYLTSGYTKLSRWLSIQRTPYTNKDMVIDQVQIVLMVTLITMIVIR